MNSDSKARFLGLFGVGVFAVWLTAGIGSGFLHCLESARWPKTDARVTSSQVDTGTSNVGTWWAPAVQYDYVVNGTSYRSDNIRFLMPHFYQQEEAADVAAPYPAGTETRISYNPRNPGEGVLEPGVPSGMWKQALIPVFFWGLTGYLWYEINHPRRRRLLRSFAEEEDLPTNEASCLNRRCTP